MSETQVKPATERLSWEYSSRDAGGGKSPRNDEVTLEIGWTREDGAAEACPSAWDGLWHRRLSVG